MTQLARLLKVALMALFGTPLGVFGESRLRFRVLPADLDINLHMNNARYLALMDLGRWDFVIRSGLWRHVLGDKWQPVLGGAHVRFRRPAAPFVPLVLSTRLITWDERWLYIEHRMESRGRLVCLAQVRAAFVGRQGVVSPARVVAAAGHAERVPAEPAWVQGWRALDGALEQKPPEAVLEEMSWEA